jgi:hypothetical protein
MILEWHLRELAISVAMNKTPKSSPQTKERKRKTGVALALLALSLGDVEDEDELVRVKTNEFTSRFFFN